ncbi:aminotransferase class I/II-fold pyridoxal phosphate-dependent enzyme [Colwellia sp. MEBiC06753]
MSVALEFHPPIACSSNYPQPSVTATPSQAHFSFTQSKRAITWQFVQNSVFTKNGRSALALIIKQLGLEEGQTVLLPEYHCPAMIEPFLWAKLNVVFYSLNDDLSVDIEGFKQLISSDVSAVVLVRFFGFPTNIFEAMQLSVNENIRVIEDCAHAFFSTPLTNGNITSDASFCSLNKFFSCVDGGKLRFANQALSNSFEKLPRPNLAKDIKQFLGRFDVVSNIASLVKSRGSTTPHSALSNADTSVNVEQHNKTFRYFDEQDLAESCYSSSKIQLKFENFDFAVSKRRYLYQKFYHLLMESTLGVPLFPLDEDTVPYVLPFLLHDPKEFHTIRQQGIQILRWEEFCHSDNQMIESYRERLIQIPCHQDLTREQIALIAKVLSK